MEVKLVECEMNDVFQPEHINGALCVHGTPPFPSSKRIFVLVSYSLLLIYEMVTKCGGHNHGMCPNHYLFTAYLSFLSMW